MDPFLKGEPVKTEVENVSDVKKIVRFEIPWEQVDNHIKETIRQISRRARIPGFRPGKAPESIIKSRYAEQIKEDVIQHLVPEAYREMVQENKLDVISEPSLEDVVYTEGSPLTFKVSVETRPNVAAKDYKALELQAEKLEVKDEEVEGVLKSYQEQAAELIPLPDTPAQKGHHLVSHFKASVKGDGKERVLSDSNGIFFIGGEEKNAAIEDNLIGKKAGETAEFNVTYPADGEEKGLAGKTVHYRIKIDSVNEKRVAPLDDEFAKDLGDFTSLTDLKEKIKKDVLQLKTVEQKNKLKDEALKLIIEKNPFEVPESLVKKEAESLLQDYARSLHQKGVNIKDPEINWNEIMAGLSKQADQNIRGSYLLDAIAREEKIEVAGEDVEKAMNQIADQQKRAPEAVKAELVKADKMDALKNRIRINKTLDFLLEHASIKQI
jgi:trigger factor